MERIQELRTALEAGTITRAEVAELDGLIRAEAAAMLNDVTDENIAAARELRTVLDLVLAKAGEMDAAEAAELAAAFAVTDPDPDDDGEGSEGEGDAPEVTAPTVEQELEPIAAAASIPTVPPAVSRVAARSPKVTAPRPLVERPAMSLTAAANVPGITAGESLDDPEKFAHAFAAAITASAGYRGETTNIPVATTSVTYPDDRFLDGDLRGNARKINAVTSLKAITASGGACAPSQVMYDLPILGTARRPVRDDIMVRFGADRGGVRVLAPPHLGDLAGGVSTWTAATDAVPGGSTKPCLTVTCPAVSETLVDAIVRCLKFGNFQARFFAEQTDAWLTLAAAQWARAAEVKLLTTMGTAANSVNVVVGQGLGTTRDIFAGLARAASAMRSRNRLEWTHPLRFAFPGWLYANMRADLIRELPGASSERLAVADSMINEFFAVQNINPSPFLDGETGQIFASQGTGPLNAWPTNVITYLFTEGSWIFLDGGTLDLGVVRDSTLNAKNDFQMFAESFEQAVFHGVESQRLNFDICPSGQTSSAVAFNPCVFGS